MLQIYLFKFTTKNVMVIIDKRMLNVKYYNKKKKLFKKFINMASFIS